MPACCQQGAPPRRAGRFCAGGFVVGGVLWASSDPAQAIRTTEPKIVLSKNVLGKDVLVKIVLSKNVLSIMKTSESRTAISSVVKLWSG